MKNSIHFMSKQARAFSVQKDDYDFYEFNFNPLDYFNKETKEVKYTFTIPNTTESNNITFLIVMGLIKGSYYDDKEDIQGGLPFKAIRTHVDKIDTVEVIREGNDNTLTFTGGEYDEQLFNFDVTCHFDISYIKDVI